MLNPYLMVGQVVRPQGIRGEVKVLPMTDDPQRFLTLTQVYVQAGEAYTPCAVQCTRVHDGMAYLRMEGVDGRDAAEAMRGAYLYVDRANAVPLPEDSNFICDLIGCEAVDEQGQAIGTLRDVLQTGAADVYVLDTARGELLFPALKRVVRSVDIAARRMVLDASALAEVGVYQG